MEEKIELEEPSDTQIDLDIVAGMSELEIERFADKRGGYKLQFIAAEKGHIGAVNALINRGVEFDCEVEGKKPADLACEKRQFEVVLSLLESNFQFPRNFNAENVPVELKKFSNLSSQLHEAIVKDEVEKLKDILARNTDLRYFYDVTNKSAIRAAIENKRFHLYEVLLINKIYPAPHDDMSFIIRRNLNRAERLQLKKVNETLSSSVLAEPMATLMQNSFFGPDCPDRVLYQNFVYKAYSHLLQIKRIAKLIHVVAASRVFKIVYDFKRETVSFVDPLSEPYTNGIFYSTGKIFIGAKGLLDPSQYFQVLGVIAHELCHYAMMLTYDNMAKPYYKKDKAGEKKFEEIIKECKGEMDKEELISLVYDEYPKELYHAETIVRVPHMVAQYHENQEILIERIQTYPSLFKNYDEEVMPEMEKALPRIKKKYRTGGEKKLEKQRRLIVIISAILALFVLASIPLGIWLKGTIYTWDSLSDVQKAKVNDAPITYFDVEVPFEKLFTNNSDVHRQLTHAQIKGALDGNPEDLNIAVNTNFLSSIILKWENMSIKLKDKVLSTNVTFQGSSVPMDEILSYESLALPLLSSLNLKSILNSSLGFEIASKIENNLNFYQERKFIGESCTWYNQCKVKTCDEIIIETSERKKFVLSSKAGEGKSATMKHFALELKEKYPWMWIQEVDLKKNLKAFRVGEKLNLTVKEELVSFLANDLINSTGFNREVFKELFEKNQVVFLWDGADEIFPRFKNFMMNLVKNIATLTKNWQFISTREEYSNFFQNNLKVRPFKLVPIDENERFEFLLKYIGTSLFQLDAKDFYENFKSFQYVTKFSDESESYLATFNKTTRENITNAVVRGKKTLKSIENSSQRNNLITNPLLIRMIAETSSFNESSHEENGIYSIYDNFVHKKQKLARKRGEIVEENINNVTNNEKVHYKKIHQVYALKLIFEEFVFDSFNCDANVINLKTVSLFFDEKIKKFTSNVKPNQISRYGILTVNSYGDFDFVHRTFAEFFVAQYFINNVDDLKEADEDFTKTNFFILNSIFFSGRFEVVKNFLIDYFAHNNVDSFAMFINGSLNFESLNYKVHWDVLNYFSFVNASFHFANKHQIPHSSIIFSRDWFFLDFSQFSMNFVNDWNLIKGFFDKEVLTLSLKLRQGAYGFNFLNEIFRMHINSDDTKSFLAIFKATLSQTELQELYFINYGSDAMIEASEFKKIIINGCFLEILWNFTTSIFDKEGQKKILLMEDDQKYSALELSIEKNLYGYKPNPSSFKLMQSVYESVLEPKEIKKIIESGAFFKLPIHSENVEYCQTVSDFMFKLYSNEKNRLRKLLIYQYVRGTIFNQYSDNNKCIKIYKNLLRETYGDDEEKLFESEFDALDNTLNINLRNLKREDIFINDYQNILTKLAPHIKEKPLKELWKFLNTTLNATDMKAILLQRDQVHRPLIKIFKDNKHRKSFEFIQKVYEENFTTEEIINFLKHGVYKPSKEKGNDETIKAVKLFLGKLVANDKIALKELFNIKFDASL